MTEPRARRRSVMFDQELWRRQIAERLSAFARNPRQEIQLSGAPGLLSYLVVQTLMPFVEAFQEDPIQSVLTLAAISRSSGANQLVRRAARRSSSARQRNRARCIKAAIVSSPIRRTSGVALMKAIRVTANASRENPRISTTRPARRVVCSCLLYTSDAADE